MSKKTVWKRALVAISLMALGALVILVGSCGGTQVPPTAQPPTEAPQVDPLAGTQWQVQSYQNPMMGGMVSPLAGTQLTASWAGGQVSGSAGCNSYSAAYTLPGKALAIQPPVVTKMACGEPAGIMDQETAFLAALVEAGTFTQTSAQLQIFDTMGQVTIILVPYAGPLPTATETPAAAGSAWERIQAAGKIVAGTSSGYPPFEYYVGPDLDGFDIALMDNIAQRLGLRVEYKDLDAETVVQSLTDGDIDVAIAHIVWTEERAQYVDFSKVYFTDKPAALALQDSDITLTTLEDLTKYRVGVQNNSVYEIKMKSLFDQAGLPSFDYVFGYVDADRAVQALKEGEVEMVAMHNQAAQAYVAQGGVREVGVAKNPLYLVIALPKGDTTLKAEIDDVIKALFDDGTISDLSERYMGESTLEPTPTAEPTTVPQPTSTPKPGECSNRMELVKDVAVGDVKPGAGFTKTWQVKNTGTCTWSKAYQLGFVSGEKMSGGPLAVAGEVKANAIYEFKLNLVAPVEPGAHQGLWQMVDPKGTLFGEKLKASVNVPAAPTATPKPTQTPSPYVRLWADDEHIKANESTYLRWEVTQVDSYWLWKEGQNWKDHPMQGDSGKTEVTPSKTTTWYLKALLKNGKYENRDQTIYVEAPPPEVPKITRFTADPETVKLGDCVTLRWEVDNQVNKATLYANAQVIYTGGTDISTKHCPDKPGPVDYFLEVVNDAGADTDDEQVTVVAAQAPVITLFSVDPEQVKLGECVTLQWAVDSPVERVTLYANAEVVWRGGPADVSTRHCPEVLGTMEYLVEVENANGVDNDSEDVNVVEPAPNAPSITSFSVEPQAPAFGEDSLWLTGAVEIRWEIGGGEATEVRLTANDVLLAEGTTTGSYSHTPEAVGPVEYKIWAKGPGGEDDRAKTINVVEPALPPETPTPEVPDPHIKYFKVEPLEIQVGGCVSIAWSVSDGTTWVRILRDQQEIFSDAVFDSQTQDCSRDQPGQYAYQLEASNSVGVIILSEAFVVNVAEAAPPPPPELPTAEPPTAEPPTAEPQPPENPVTGTNSQ